VPGPVSSRLSAGPNNLLTGGACLVRDAQDVLDAMLGPGVRRIERAGPALEPAQRSVLEALESGAETCDAIAMDLELAGGEAAAVLADLESLGYVSCSLVGVYVRTNLQPPSGI
jgi:DNA processing protein